MNAQETRDVLMDEASKNGFLLVWCNTRKCQAHLQRMNDSELRMVEWRAGNNEETVRYMVRLHMKFGTRLDQ